LRLLESAISGTVKQNVAYIADHGTTMSSVITLTIELRKSMKIFISYGGPTDQVTALRLQALASVNGLTVYVPPAHTRQMGNGLLVDAESGQKLKEADVVLGVVGAPLTDACRNEFNLALSLGKQMIVMAYPWFAEELQAYLAPRVVVVDPMRPGDAEVGIVQHLKSLNMQKTTNTALVALGTLALGLLLFAATAERE
jgi:hypothetical protein